jgi:TRAP-type C4-dicarboxylate transport system substrate-binding protein
MFQALVDRAGVSSVSVNVPDVLVALQTKILEVVFNSPYYALVTQWYTQVSHFTDLPISYMGGALIMDKKAFQKIPPPLQETLKKVAAKHTRRLTERTRKDNADAFEAILKRGVRKVTPNEAQVKGFQEIGDKAMGDLIPKYLQKSSVDRVKAVLQEARAK